MSGYNYDFVDKPPQRLLCKICQLPCRDPQRSLCCSSVFCKSELKEDSCPWPECHSKDLSTFVDKALHREIRELISYCPNKNRNGCDWTGEIARIDDHLRGCKISCSKCKQIVYFSTMKSHLDTECPCYCPYCDITAEREVINSEHKEKCPKFPLTCPNNCGMENIPRDNMDEHKKVCPLEIIQCEYHCGAMIACNEVSQHNADNVLQHVYSVKKELTISFQHATQLEQKCVETERCLVASTTSLSNTTKAIAIKILLNAKHTKMLSINHMPLIPRLLLILLKCITVVVIMNLLFYGYMDYVTMITKRNHQIISDVDVSTSLAVHDLIENIPSLRYELMLGYSTPFYWQWELQLKCWSKTDLVAPVIIEMPDIDEHIKNKLEWISNPFYAFKGGYLMCLRVYVDDNGDVAGTYMSVYLHLMKGQHDDELSWPMRGEYTITLLNPMFNFKRSHHSLTVRFDTNVTTVVRNYERVTIGTINPIGIGFPEYISTESVLFVPQHYYSYLSQHNSLFFKVYYTRIL